MSGWWWNRTVGVFRTGTQGPRACLREALRQPKSGRPNRRSGYQRIRRSPLASAQRAIRLWRPPVCIQNNTVAERLATLPGRYAWRSAHPECPLMMYADGV